MRTRYIQQKDGTLVEASRYVRPKVKAPLVMGDIQPYQSMIDGSEITSRSKHREHLKQHGCFEVGNEVKHLKSYGDYTPPKGLKETLIRVFNEKVR